ncbi:hypothetical protein RSAG8_13480, partial [Rhizoctonia solani AG-8 WAC10335]
SAFARARDTQCGGRQARRVAGIKSNNIVLVPSSRFLTVTTNSNPRRRSTRFFVRRLSCRAVLSLVGARISPVERATCHLKRFPKLRCIRRTWKLCGIVGASIRWIGPRTCRR